MCVKCRERQTTGKQKVFVLKECNKCETRKRSEKQGHEGVKELSEILCEEDVAEQTDSGDDDRSDNNVSPTSQGPMNTGSTLKVVLQGCFIIGHINH